MALIVVATNNFIEISLDGTTDFDSETDLLGLGLVKNAPSGLRIRKIFFVPGTYGDTVIVRDSQNGPRMFEAQGYGVSRDDFREDGHVDRGKLVSPYIHANEIVVSEPNLAFVIFEL